MCQRWVCPLPLLAACSPISSSPRTLLSTCTLAGDGLHRRIRDDSATNLLKYHASRTQAHGSFIEVRPTVYLSVSQCDQQAGCDAAPAGPISRAPLCAHLAVNTVHMLRCGKAAAHAQPRAADEGVPASARLRSAAGHFAGTAVERGETPTASTTFALALMLMTPSPCAHQTHICSIRHFHRRLDAVLACPRHIPHGSLAWQHHRSCCDQHLATLH